MSEELALPPSGESKYTTPTDNEVKSENAAAPKATAQKVYDDDLEDGEIDDEDENDEHTDNAHSKIIGAAPTAPVVIAVNKPIQPLIAQKIAPDIDAGDKKSKYKKHNIVEDDFAGSIESAIAAALKKNGIMPPMPKMLESRDEIDKQSDKDIISSKSSRRRKRRKLREKEKEKEKKKHRPSSPGNTLMGPLNDDDVDDDEMLCIRGGSPPPAGLATPLPQLDPGMSKKEGYDTDQTYTSYDSYDSGHNYSRYSSSRKKDGNSGSRSGRKERSSSRRDDDRRSEKRSRRNYDDSASEDKYQDRHPQQPRKMELCKFYLMECCAKKDKCSYMHSDFPCKYYYLGKDCVYRSACKFSHGKPLTEQLRNILLKHLETAPKEILGTFRRISRENALHLMNTTHERLCEEHGVENTLNTSTNQSIIQSQATGMRNGDLLLQQQQNQNQQASPAQQQHQQHHQQQHQQQHQHQQQQHQHHLHQHHQQQQHQQQQQQQQHNQQSEIIPSLLDMVINIPPATSETPTNLITNTVPSTTVLGQSKAEKQRKSRWCDSNAAALKQTNLEPPSSSAPSYLDLKNLIGILSTDRIEKLSQLGVVNLEQINQLTLSQLNNIGLTVTEINEIQLNAQNMARLGVPRVNGDVGTANLPASGSSSIPSSQDVDMRFLPSCLPLTTTSTTTITTSHDPSKDLNNDIGVGPTDQQIHTSGVMELTDDVTTSLKDSHSGASNLGGIDYSQYLRDSNLGYDKNDLLDDERDEEQLVIDDQDMDTTDDNSQANQPEAKDDAENDAKSSAGFSYGCDDSNDVRLPPAIHLSEQLQSLLKDPGNLYTVNVSALLKSTDALTGKIESDSIKSKASSSKHDDGGFYGAAAVGRDIDSRHEYRESRATDYHEDNRDHRLTDKKDEFRDPRLSSRSNEQGGSTSFSYRPNNSDNESDRSKSSSPTLAQQMENYVSIYERKSMYDWTPKCEQEDLEYSRRNIKADKDMRLSGFLDSPNSDIDLRLPFQPVKNMQIANEIDGSISALMPITYKISEIDVPEPKYSYLRHSFQCDDSTDPRLRRILGLPELSNSKVLAALGSSSRPTIASPSSVESSSSPTREKEIPSTSIVRGPRVDPRRAAAAAAATSTSTTSGGAQIVPAATSNPQQNVEIRMLLQKSDWYKNLNSKYKIMVNQQLALVSTELKRFHQDPSPNKVFDIQFIVNNQNLQQILTNLGIFIDDNGQVAHIENDIDMMVGTNYGSNGNPLMMMNDQNMSIQQRMAMQHQIEFLRGPPPNINMLGLGGGNAHGGPGPQQGMFGGPGGMMTPTFDRNPRYSLLGIPPGGGSGGGGGYNPFAGNPGENGGGAGLMDAGYCGLNNPFANNFGGNDSNNSGNFGGQPINRGNRNNFNRQGGNGNGGNRMNRRNFKPNNQRDRRGGGGGGGGSGGVNQNNNKGMDEL